MHLIISFFAGLKKLFVRWTGVYFYDVKDLPVGTHLPYFIKYKFAAPIKVIVDVGANVGQTALLFHSHFPKAHIYCFEPFLETYEKLESNLKGVSGIFCNNLALGDKNEDVIVLRPSEGDSLRNSLKNDIGFEQGALVEESVRVVTLDSFVGQLGERINIDLLKIDTEGYDLRVIKGAIGLLNAGLVKMVFCEVGFSKDNDVHVHFCEMNEFLENVGFVFVGLFNTNVRKVLERPVFGNALFVSKEYLHLIKA
jgi:FkbM family methyltransferase